MQTEKTKPFFIDQIAFGKKETNLVFRVNDTEKLTTGDYPDTIKILSKELKSIFWCKCFNKKGLVFIEEVADTELGHLYEHILLEYITELKFSKEGGLVKVNGLTSWNWEEDSRGVFRIKLSMGENNRAYLEEAIAKADRLLGKIMGLTATRPNTYVSERVFKEV